MMRLKRMGINTVVITAAFANAAGVAPHGGKSEAADPPPGAPNPTAARKAALAA